MSRSLTAAQVISLGEYLNPNFDPASLTVSQLLGVLGFHNVQYPTPYSKPKLIQLFVDEITAKSTKLKRERQKKEQSLASDDGITDGVTGRPIGKEKMPPARRSSRRVSRSDLENEVVSQPDPPKRRRSSAQPNLGGTSRKKTSSQPVLVEESEPEENDEVVVRKVGRSKKGSETAGAQARRISVAEDSGWEDNNIFQSGAESSSPIRSAPSKPKAPRKSASVRQARKSMSAPPHSSPSSSPPKAPQFAEHIQQTQQSPMFKFEPSLPPSFSREARVAAATEAKRNSIVSPKSFPHPEDKDISDDELDIIGADTSTNHVEVVHIANDLFDNENVEEADEDQTVAVSRRIAQGGQLVATEPQTRSTPWALRILYFLIAAVCFIVVVSYKMESAHIGYCDTGTNTNAALQALNAKWDAIESCNLEDRPFLQLPPLSWSSNGTKEDSGPTLCLPPALVSCLRTTRCTPCPEHASCTKDTVKCDNGFLLKPHPLLSILSPFDSSTSPLGAKTRKLIEDVTSGLPYFGPVVFPQRCVEDPQRKKNIGALGKAVEALLGQERGLRLCASDGSEAHADRDGGEARNWGMEMGELREMMKKKTPPQLLPTFDDTFNEAIQQLVQWGGVVLGEDSSGNRYLAHKTANLTLSCAITVKSREIWAAWRATVLMIAALISGSFVLKARRASQAVENKRVGELVQIALDTLRNQELAHHTDPVTAPQPYLSSLQLRDLILQDEHSISTRRRLWDQVERVVEGNANVRANLQEVYGGDELRVWRWIGGAGRSPGMRKKVQFDNRGD